MSKPIQQSLRKGDRLFVGGAVLRVVDVHFDQVVVTLTTAQDAEDEYRNPAERAAIESGGDPLAIARAITEHRPGLMDNLSRYER